MKIIQFIIYLNLHFLKEMQNLIINLRNFFLRGRIVKNFIYKLFSKKKRIVFFNENINK